MDARNFKWKVGKRYKTYSDRGPGLVIFTVDGLNGEYRNLDENATTNTYHNGLEVSNVVDEKGHELNTKVINPQIINSVEEVTESPVEGGSKYKRRPSTKKRIKRKSRRAKSRRTKSRRAKSRRAKSHRRSKRRSRRN